MRAVSALRAVLLVAALLFNTIAAFDVGAISSSCRSLTYNLTFTPHELRVLNYNSTFNMLLYQSYTSSNILARVSFGGVYNDYSGGRLTVNYYTTFDSTLSEIPGGYNATASVSFVYSNNNSVAVADGVTLQRYIFLPIDCASTPTSGSGGANSTDASSTSIPSALPPAIATPHSNTAAIAGGVAGGVACFALLAAIVFCKRRRRRQAGQPQRRAAHNDVESTSSDTASDGKGGDAMTTLPIVEQSVSRHIVPVAAAPPPKPATTLKRKPSPRLSEANLPKSRPSSQPATTRVNPLFLSSTEDYKMPPPPPIAAAAAPNPLPWQSELDGEAMAER